jgi:hypothetical protein
MGIHFNVYKEVDYEDDNATIFGRESYLFDQHASPIYNIKLFANGLMPRIVNWQLYVYLLAKQTFSV